ncbi:DUF2631 domain-containing protein [Pseudonocardia sp.]|uniref:DUF2631 domain-containing protein n=1 Tax=Pseudonocardia sp. TaxID=60912 RepID=UPI00260634D3|nr:DUF2631 domain-containing protein [Pseudonocardia sp.]
MASNSRELAQQPAVDPEEEPSAEWGWHGGFPRAMVVAGWVSVASLLLMLIGNHSGQTENLWLVGVAIVMAAALVWHSAGKRNSWRR